MTKPLEPPELSLDSAVALLGLGRLGAVLEAVGEGASRLSEAQLGELTAAALGVRALAEGLAFALTAEADARGVIAASSAASTAQWVRRRAEEGDAVLSPGVAQGFAEVVKATRCPGLALVKEATARGRVPVGAARVVAAEFRGMRTKIDPACHEAALGALIDYAAGGAGGRALAEARDTIVSQYGLPGEFDEECDQRAAHRHMSSFARTTEGMYEAEVVLDPASYAVVHAALTALSVPTVSLEGFSDVRTPGQRRADALVELASVVAGDPAVLARSAHAPENAPIGRAAAARVVITMPWQWLSEQSGHGRTGFEQPLAPADVRRIACDAQIIPLVLGSESQPLDVGRASRLATPAQRAALAVRDKGCTFPGCDRPPSWCQAHHLHEWENGGPTDLPNLALLCHRHHTLVHRDRLIGTLDGPPEGPGTPVRWRPPDHRDGPTLDGPIRGYAA